MRKLCPNLERDDALDTVLEVPIPEEMFSGGGGSRGSTRFGCTNVKAWMRSHAADRSGAGEPCSMTRGELQLMLGVIGAPLIPLPVYHANQSPCSVLCEQLKADPIVRTTTERSNPHFSRSRRFTDRLMINPSVSVCALVRADPRSRPPPSTSCSST
jgi:hypothetical protein